jgi:hypothetical protein
MTIRFTAPQLLKLEHALREDCRIIMRENADTTINHSNAQHIIESITNVSDKDWRIKDWIKTMISHDFYVKEPREIMDELTNEELVEQGDYFEPMNK